MGVAAGGAVRYGTVAPPISTSANCWARAVRTTCRGGTGSTIRAPPDARGGQGDRLSRSAGAWLGEGRHGHGAGNSSPRGGMRPGGDAQHRRCAPAPPRCRPMAEIAVTEAPPAEPATRTARLIRPSVAPRGVDHRPCERSGDNHSRGEGRKTSAHFGAEREPVVCNSCLRRCGCRCAAEVPADVADIGARGCGPRHRDDRRRRRGAGAAADLLLVLRAAVVEATPVGENVGLHPLGRVQALAPEWRRALQILKPEVKAEARRQASAAEAVRQAEASPAPLYQLPVRLRRHGGGAPDAARRLGPAGGKPPCRLMPSPPTDAMASPWCQLLPDLPNPDRRRSCRPNPACAGCPWFLPAWRARSRPHPQEWGRRAIGSRPARLAASRLRYCRGTSNQPHHWPPPPRDGRYGIRPQGHPSCRTPPAASVCGWWARAVRPAT